MALARVAGKQAEPAGGPHPGAFELDRGGSRPPTTRRACSGVLRRTGAGLLPPGWGAPGVVERVRTGRRGLVSELWPLVGTAAGVGPGRTTRQRAGLQPLRRR